MAALLTDFRALAPAQRVTQAQTFAWLAAAHTRAEATRARLARESFDEERFQCGVVRALSRFGCGADKIAERGLELDDCTHTRWSEMQIYRLHESPCGEGMLRRSRAFQVAADRALSRLYAEVETPPGHLVHVTCTGYVSPSAAQRLVASKGWGSRTQVTHAYHMGCYAAFPAVRMAAGMGALAGTLLPSDSDHVDVVHTEICSLHMNALAHTPEQFVVQTLFADGSIAYSVRQQSRWDGGSPALVVNALLEETVPDSADAMVWTCSDHGMQMTLARDVPERVGRHLRDFVRRLVERAGIGQDELHRALYAVHPGGPRILDGVRDALEIGEEKLSFSRELLHERGNLSSATLPHVWMQIAESDRVGAGSPVVSLAFGPGLTLSGAVMQKVVSN